MKDCSASPTLTSVGDTIHVECPACGLDYFVARTGVA